MRLSRDVSDRWRAGAGTRSLARAGPAARAGSDAGAYSDALAYTNAFADANALADAESDALTNSIANTVAHADSHSNSRACADADVRQPLVRRARKHSCDRAGWNRLRGRRDNSRRGWRRHHGHQRHGDHRRHVDRELCHCGIRRDGRTSRHRHDC